MVTEKKKKKQSKTRSKKEQIDRSQPTGKPMIETCHLGRPYCKFHDLNRMESSYNHEHLSTLFFIVSNFEIQNVLDVGTGPGHTAFTMAEAGATVTTLDIEDCEEAKDLWLSYEIPNINFIKIKPGELDLHSTGYDLIHIDGGHSLEEVVSDIKSYLHLLTDGGFLVFHDTTNPAWPGVAEAVDKIRSTLFYRYDWFNCNGLTVFRRKMYEFE
jgi:predicted O-methyltransferase YrrM